ncbi:3-oxoacyl-ACP synthase [Mycobacterium sp. 852002-50816_SCH5313054-b]|uniref:3-oxoacyl-ACP synthase III family protein n=1 Tax=Mycobacterium sp. 852002-50816_SCH5313054-b TaxID=1834092 RepID=UPI0007FEF988|nr:ketoacyl-ACP synthase III family protein [Mycobacterium sp. 852002-50816_SCH5313054-b]OBF55326.1 3-oxoacyl-ACP synthase [Mycobacterium sp. 852002-50816_SCH5313054-b]
MTTPPVSLIDVSTYLPENTVCAEYYAGVAGADELRDSVMFRAPAFRHHAAKDESNTDMIERAVQGLLKRHGAKALSDVDVLLAHSQLLDAPFVGCAGAVAHRLGIAPEWTVDVQNGGCAAFVHMMRLARQLLQSGAGRKALIVLAQRCAGTVFDQQQVRKLAQAAIPGDGAAAGLLTLSDRSPIIEIVCRDYGEYAADMAAISDPPRRWWESGPGEGYISFTGEAVVAEVLARGNRLVPEVVQVVCDRIGMKSEDLDLLVTNQPNQLFLRNWDKALGLPPARHRDTFHQCGNLFGVGIPVNFDFAINDGQVKPGDVVMMAAFAHAGDFAGAAALRWGGRPQ